MNNLIFLPVVTYLQVAAPAQSSSFGMFTVLILLIAIIAGVTFYIGKKSRRFVDEDKTLPVRPSLLTALLYLGVVVNVVMLIAVFVSTPFTWVSAVSVISSFVTISALYFLIKWRKLGFYLVIIGTFISFVTSIFVSGFGSAVPILTVPVFWYLVLQLKSRDGVSVWKHLK